MAEYIEREALLKVPPFTKRAGAIDDYVEGYLDCVEDATEAINKMPTADVVEVVRCKDCMYGEHCYPSKRTGEEAEPAYWCKFTDQIVSVDGYCVYGKKMDGKGEGE